MTPATPHWLSARWHRGSSISARRRAGNTAVGRPALHDLRGIFPSFTCNERRGTVHGAARRGYPRSRSLMACLRAGLRGNLINSRPISRGAGAARAAAGTAVNGASASSGYLTSKMPRIPASRWPSIVQAKEKRPRVLGKNVISATVPGWRRTSLMPGASNRRVSPTTDAGVERR